MVITKADPSDMPEPHSGELDEAAKPGAIRVLVADSHAIYRAGMCKILAPEPDIRVVSEVDSVSSLHSAIESIPSDVVILEGNLVSKITDAIPELVRLAPAAKIIVETTAPDESDTVELYRCGVRGVIARSISPDLLVKSVRKVAAGETWIDNESVNGLIEELQSQTADGNGSGIQPQMSTKELAIMTCINQGMKNKEIAYRLGTTEQTIKNYLSKMYKKLNVSDRLGLALYCQNHEFHKDLSAAKVGRGSNASDTSTNGNGGASR